MKIGVDGRALTGHLGGTGYYVLETLRAMASANADDTFVLFTRDTTARGLPPNVTIEVDQSVSRRLPGPAWSRIACGRACDTLDVFWAAATITPCWVKVPVVSTIYDLNHLLYPTTMPIATRLGHKLWFRASLREAALRVAISQGTADRVNNAYGIVCEAIALPGLGTAFQGIDAEHLVRPPAPTPYILSVATREPRKNLGNLLRAVDQLHASDPSAPELWLVGGTGWGDAVDKAFRTLLEKPWCRKLGYVDSHALPALYAQASAFAFPSLYEGYGIPVAEARACGVPVVTTDLPELHEAGGDDAIYVSSTPDAIAHGLRKALALTKSSPRIAAYRDAWATCAETTMHALKTVHRKLR